MTTTVSYLHKRLTLIFAHEIQASKSSFLKITAPYISTCSSLFYKSIYAKQKQSVAVKKVLPSKVESML